jgi:hypothetical protein
VFRTALVTIVLTLTLGQTSGLLCPIWCHAEESVATGCPHTPNDATERDVTAAAIDAGDACAELAASAAFVREDSRRGAFAVEALPPAPLHWLQPTSRPSVLAPASSAALPAGPLVSPLRI